MKEFIVERTIKIKASPAEVWDALTNPERTKNYFFHARVISDWKAGSTITFKGKVFLVIPFEMSGKIIRIEPEKFLQYTLKNGKKDAKEGYSTIIDTLTYENGYTTLFIADDVGKADGAEKRYARSEKGWDKILSGLKKEVEG